LAEQELMTIGDLSACLSIKRSWIYQHINDIPHYKIGTMLRFDRERIQQWLDKGEKSGAANPPLKRRDTPVKPSADILSYKSRATN
jgi:excisionase family DNA binding protein